MPAPTRAIRRALPFGLLAFVLCGCLAEGPDPVRPSGVPATTATPVSSRSAEPVASRSLAPPTPTPIPPIARRGPGFEVTGVEPTPAVEEGIRRASIDVDGVRLTIEAAGNPLRAGEVAWITTTLRNTGRDTLHWTTDGCEIHVGVVGEMPFRWAGGFAQGGVARTFKDWAYVANLPELDRPIWLAAVQERFVGKANFGCADLAVPHELEPGRHLSQRHRWDGTAAPDLGLPPSGPAEWIGTFSFWWRDADPAVVHFENPRDPLVVRLPVDIVRGRDPGLLSAGQAIDVAVTVPALRALLEANRSIQDWDMPITTRFDSASGLWQVGLKTDDGFSVIVHIEPRTGAVVRVVEDPFPAS